MLKLGSLFSGAGGLDMAVEALLGTRTVWLSDIVATDKEGRKVGDAPRILAHRFPNVPNLGDITRVDWPRVERVHVVAGGSPCPDLSTAGKRAGMVAGTRSNLWVEMREAIAVLEPALVIWENVHGATSARAFSAMESDPGLLGDHPAGRPVLRALGRVLGDLAVLGFDAAWHCLRAADIGAPHGRPRVFVVAAHPERVARLQRRVAAPGQASPRRTLGAAARRDRAPIALLPTPRASRGASDTETVALLPTPVVADGDRSSVTYGRGNPTLVGALLPTPSAGNFNASETPEQWEARRQRVKATARNGNGMGMPLGIAVQLLPTPAVADAMGGRKRRGGARSGELLLKGIAAERQWGRYADAVTRWEALLRPAPAPTTTTKRGAHVLNPEFSQWMMGWPDGWVTDVPGMKHTWQHHAIGNGVVPQQAAAAIRWCLDALGLDWPGVAA